MAISGPSSYVPTVQDFLSHWESVNDELGEDLVLVQDGALPGSSTAVTRANLVTMLGTLVGTHTEVTNNLADVSVQRAQQRLARQVALDSFNAFTARVRSDLGHTPYALALPAAPSLTDGLDAFSRPLMVAVRLWSTINGAVIPGFTGPLLLVGGVTLVTFLAQATAVTTTAAEQRDLEVDLKVARGRRDDVQAQIYPILKKYRQTVPTRFAEGHAMVDTLPVLTPESGRTPVAPVAAAEWNATEERGQVSFTEIDDPDVRRYSLRWSPGDTYSTEDEEVLESLNAGAGTVFLTLQGLGSPGAVSLFRVVVELTNGHEAGSAPVQVTRPSA